MMHVYYLTQFWGCQESRSSFPGSVLNRTFHEAAAKKLPWAAVSPPRLDGDQRIWYRKFTYTAAGRRLPGSSHKVASNVLPEQGHGPVPFMNQSKAAYSHFH